MNQTNYSFCIRKNWIQAILNSDTSFLSAFETLKELFCKEMAEDTTQYLLTYLRYCGAIPESIQHDSSHEKLYSKYTDFLISQSFTYMGFNSVVLSERADHADVDVIGEQYDFVADAKAFRLSRTAKNQKDFKIEAMTKWKRERTYALVVAPAYQLPTKNSQIYEQSIRRGVLILSYQHLAVLIKLKESYGETKVQCLLSRLFQVLLSMPATKDATFYWKTLNQEMLAFDASCPTLWNEEKQETYLALSHLKEEGLSYWDAKRKEILLLSKEEAVQILLAQSKIESKIKTISQITIQFV
jgi:hypothetical protein